MSDNQTHLYKPDESYNQSQILLFTVSASAIWIMIPGLGFLYSGLARRKSALSMIWICFMSSMVGIFQWYFWGYSLAFSPSSNKFIGNLKNFGFKDIISTENSDYPEISYAIFQLQFFLVTLAIIAGACSAERGRFLPALVFLFCWGTIVYCPVAYWVWNPNGWAFNYKSGVLDYAGGGPVEILSAVTSFVYSIFLGKRKSTSLVNYRPHNITNIFLGVTLLYFGWLFFNGFSCGTVSVKVPYSMMNTHLCAAFGALAWGLLDFRMEKKWSMVAVCSGCISGLVAATPSSGCIPLWASIILGILSGVLCNFATNIKVILRVDDSLDVLAEHGIAGIIGLIFNALFGSSTVIGYDGVTSHEGGWLDHNYKQLYIQIAYICAVTGYCAVVTAILCFVIDKIPGLHLRVDEDAEERGTDEDQIGEFAYDYVEVRRDFLDWGVPSSESGSNSEKVVQQNYMQPEIIPANSPENSSQHTATANTNNEYEK